MLSDLVASLTLINKNNCIYILQDVETLNVMLLPGVGVIAQDFDSLVAVARFPFVF